MEKYTSRARHREGQQYTMTTLAEWKERLESQRQENKLWESEDNI